MANAAIGNLRSNLISHNVSPTEGRWLENAVPCGFWRSVISQTAKKRRSVRFFVAVSIRLGLG